MLTTRDAKVRWGMTRRAVAAVVVTLAATIALTMTVAPKDGCRSWPEQINFFEASDLCAGTR